MSLLLNIEEKSIAEDSGIKTGDKILKINGYQINDQIDFSFHISDEILEIEIETKEGKLEYHYLEREYNKSLGISVVPPEITQCENACVFCFIHQQPKSMRKSLYIMDDDYRFSFSDGNFITLTNLKPHEWRRIYKLKLSPLYISVHSTNPDVREKMLKNHKARDIMKHLKNLSKHDIHFHCQIVLCYGYNDKEELDKTIEDLETLIPYLEGIAVVPSGLSQFRKNLTYLKAWDKESSIKVIKQVKKWQKYFRKKYNKSIVYLADEFYYLSEENIPPAKHYDGFYYIEDGIGTTSFFSGEFDKNKKYIPSKINKKRKVTIICGVIAGKYLKEKIDVLNKVENLEVQLIPIENNYFGKGITVTGLLTATDIIYYLKNIDIGDELIIPSVILRKEDKLFLDNYKVEAVEKALNTKIKICEMGAKNFIEASLGFHI